MDRVALNQNSNNNIPKRRVHANVLPSKIQPKSGKLHTSGSGGSGYSVNPWDVSNSPMIGRGSDTTNIHSSSPQVPRKYSSGGLYHNGSHNYGQTGGQTPSSTDGSKPPPYQPPDYASLGTGAHSGASTPRARRKEDRSSRSTDKLDSKASGRSQSLSRDSSSKFTQESDRQSRDRVRSTHSNETITETGKVNKKSRPRSQSHSRDRLSTTAAPHTSDGGDMLSRDKNSSSTKSMQESDRKSRDRVRRTHSNETVTGAEKVDRKPHPRSRSQSRDTLSTSHASDGGGMQGTYTCIVAHVLHQYNATSVVLHVYLCTGTHTCTCILGLYSDPSTHGPTNLSDLSFQIREVAARNWDWQDTAVPQ